MDAIVSLLHVSLQPYVILFNNGTHVPQLAGHPSVSAPPRAGVCDKAENRSTQARRFLWLCCSPGSILVVFGFVVTCRNHMRTHSVISYAGPRPLHDASFICKRAPSAPSYHHQIRVSLRSRLPGHTSFSFSARRLRLCLYILIASAFAFVCSVPSLSLYLFAKMSS